jgi:PAS domain S-box-containing protein
LKPGDLVELLGFPVNGEYSPILQDAIWRKVVSGPEPEPVLVGPDDALSGAQDNRLVAIEGKLIERAHNFGETVLVLEAEGRVFSAYMDSPGDGSDLAALENNSRLRLTGVCRVEVGETWRAGPEWRAKSFRILLRGPADVMVLKLPPWRAVTRLLWAVGILVTAVLAALAWAAQLRQKVNKQTAIIRRQLEKEGALKNRYQDLFENANDMVYTHDLRGRMTSINVAGERLLGRKRDSIVQCCLLDFIAEEQRILAGQWFDQIVDGTAPPTVEWNFITASGGRIRLEISTRLIEREGRHVEVEGIARDVTERRRLEREILEISTREQRRIGHDLHDGVCQQLAGIGFLSDILADKLQEQNRPEAAEAQSIAELVNKANKQTRGVARGLFPVRLEENGLASALEELAESTGTFFNTPCELRCDSPVVIPDNTVAHHLYYIAQEAILNAIKHGNARRIEVQLTKSGDGGHLLSVRNDGAALALPSARNRGMGIRIMKYRARMIGATLQIDSPPGGGVEVACRFVSDAKLEDAPSAGRGEES